MQIEEYIDKIQTASLKNRKDADWIKNNLLVKLKLNDEELQKFEPILDKLLNLPQPEQIQSQVSENQVIEVDFPPIKAIKKKNDRLLWSVMIPTYNNTKFLEQVLKSVLEQAPDPEVMQIEVVDDCSIQGDVEEIVNRVGKGRVSFYRNPQNLGLIGNWNACIERAQGDWVHILHQDDLVMPGFYAKLQAGIELKPNIGAAFCRYSYVDDEGNTQRESGLERQTPGIIENWLERIVEQQLIQCPSIVVKRSVYEQLGGYCSQAGYAADWEMWKRIATYYDFWFEPETLAAYRWHSLSATSKYTESGANIAYTRRTIVISDTYLPKDIAQTVSIKAREHYAYHALCLADGLLGLNNFNAAINQIREGLKCSESSRVMNKLASVLSCSEPLVRLFVYLLKNSQHEQIEASIVLSQQSRTNVSKLALKANIFRFIKKLKFKLEKAFHYNLHSVT